METEPWMYMGKRKRKTVGKEISKRMLKEPGGEQ